jgi:hypothetical protein
MKQTKFIPDDPVVIRPGPFIAFDRDETLCHQGLDRSTDGGNTATDFIGQSFLRCETTFPVSIMAVDFLQQRFLHRSRNVLTRQSIEGFQSDAPEQAKLLTPGQVVRQIKLP